ncbi:AbiJ-NTD4 domain-containing protein [Microbacterium sp. B24]|uniref:AbiJ-NTD4 domain-containing protein n=1 Tax=Microbacterium sp. B24 TaxID=95616 RepID=UPI0005663928|nr:hypothetical protein [Microbacterium sp. B24]
MASFAERMGHRQARSVVQSQSLDTDTRVELWNVLVVIRSMLDNADRETFVPDETQRRLIDAVWTWEFKNPRDEMKSFGQVWQAMKAHVLQGEWYDVLDLLEAIVKYLHKFETHLTGGHWEAVAEALNDRFETYIVGYRFIGRELTPVDSTIEADAVATAQSAVSNIAGARHALDRAIERLADRQNPDYPNSIKESISSVEAVVRKVTGESTLGAGLSQLEAAGLTIHPALKAAWSKMYGYASDSDGIRHGGIDAADADQALAKYMLVACSAFVSYLIEESRKSHLI